MVLLEMNHVKKSFDGNGVLKDISLKVNEGEVVSIIGPSGSGKSTLLRCLNLLEIPSSGHIYFNGVDITDKKVDINLHRQKMYFLHSPLNYYQIFLR